MEAEKVTSVRGLLTYIREHEKDIYVRGTRDNYATVETMPLAEVDAAQWAKHVEDWLRRGQVPSRIVGL